MMRDSYSYTALHKKIAECFAKDDATNLQQLLIKHRSTFVHFMEELFHPTTAKNPLDRKQIESGSVTFPNDVRIRNLSLEFSKASLLLSDRLNINELEALEWLQAAIEQRSKWSTVSDNELDAAIDLFYSERRHLLQTLYDILLGSRDTSVALSVREVCQAFIMEVVMGSLEENQIKYSTRLLKIMSYLDKELYERL